MWHKKWAVLWPKFAHPTYGQILFYFDAKNGRRSTTADGAIQLMHPVMRRPQDPRNEKFTVRALAYVRGALVPLCS